MGYRGGCRCGWVGVGGCGWIGRQLRPHVPSTRTATSPSHGARKTRVPAQGLFGRPSALVYRAAQPRPYPPSSLSPCVLISLELKYTEPPDSRPRSPPSTTNHTPRHAAVRHPPGVWPWPAPPPAPVRTSPPAQRPARAPPSCCWSSPGPVGQKGKKKDNKECV